MPRREPEFSPEKNVITVYADSGCPWASLALHGLRRARHRLGLYKVRFDLRAFPLEFANERPTPKRMIDAEVAVIGATEPSLEWRLWHGPENTWPVTTLLAMEAVQAAKRPEVGGLAASDELDAALRRAFFVESRCISLLHVILDVARGCDGVDADALAKAMQLGAGRPEVMTQWRAAKRGGVQGSPHVLLPDGQEWHNPGVELRHVGEFPTIMVYDPTVYDEIVKSAQVQIA